MATTDDIDTKSAVTKFLQSRTVIDNEDKTADSADEVQAVLEAVALSFLLYPQAALSFVLRAKNVLQQIVAADLAIVQYISKTIPEIGNPDEPITDTSDLVEAQTALVAVDRIGRVSSDVQAYARYNNAINSFLDTKLAKTLKRRGTGEFERTGNEAKQDLFKVLGVFGPTHSVMVEHLGLLLNGVSDFQSVPLTKIVATKTVSKVRSSLNKVLNQINLLSKTSIAIELLSGAASLSSISNTRQVYDPTVNTGTFPSGRTIAVSSEAVGAVATGTATSVDLTGVTTPWTLGITIDPDLVPSVSSIELPTAGGEGRYYVKAATGSLTYNISPSNCTLYVEFDGISPPTNVLVPLSRMIRAVTLPTGSAVTISAILSALNNVSTGLIDGTAVQLGNTGRILIYGSSSVTGIVVRKNYVGSYDGFGNWSDAPGSVHTVLGFSDDQQSGTLNVFSPTELADFFNCYLTAGTASVDANGALQVASNTIDLRSSVSFSGIASHFGFSTTTTYRTQPGYIELIENGVALDPSTLGVFVGSVVSVADQLGEISHNLFAPIDSINGTQLVFAPGTLLPRCLAANDSLVKIVSPLVFAVQSMLATLTAFVGIYDNDARDLQRVLSPLLSTPTLAQTNDALKTLTGIQTKVNNLLTALSNVVVRPDRSEFESIATQIIAALQERGLDRGLDLLQACQFSDFFNLTPDDASKGSRFLKASEQVGRNDLGSTTSEQDKTDLKPKATTPDQNLLPGEDLLEDEEQQ